jgi:hypothetical protein
MSQIVPRSPRQIFHLETGLLLGRVNVSHRQTHRKQILARHYIEYINESGVQHQVSRVVFRSTLNQGLTARTLSLRLLPIVLTTTLAFQ